MQNELYHYGILGQKWGIRRYQNKDGTLTDAGKKRYRSTSRKSEKQRTSEKAKIADLKNRGALSTAQLKEKIERLQMEKQLRELTESEINPGKAYVKKLLKDTGTRVITTAAVGGTLYLGKAALSKEFNAKEFGNAIFNGGAKKK